MRTKKLDDVDEATLRAPLAQDIERFNALIYLPLDRSGRIGCHEVISVRAKPTLHGTRRLRGGAAQGHSRCEGVNLDF